MELLGERLEGGKALELLGEVLEGERALGLVGERLKVRCWRVGVRGGVTSVRGSVIGGILGARITG